MRMALAAMASYARAVCALWKRDTLIPAAGHAKQLMAAPESRRSLPTPSGGIGRSGKPARSLVAEHRPVMIRHPWAASGRVDGRDGRVATPLPHLVPPRSGHVLLGLSPSRGYAIATATVSSA